MLDVDWSPDGRVLAAASRDQVARLWAIAGLVEAGGQIAALVGEPGVGKSRLVWELTHSHRTEG